MKYFIQNNFLIKQIVFTIAILSCSCTSIFTRRQPLRDADVVSYKTLAVYFKRADDTFEFGNHTKLNWPCEKIEPNWKGQLLIPTKFDASTASELIKQYPKSITAFYYLMSNRKVWIYGDEVTYTGAALSNQLRNEDRACYQKWLENNTAVMQWLLDNYFNSGKRDYQDFSILFINRARPKHGYQGIATLPTNQLENDSGQAIRLNGIYQTDCYSLDGTRRIVCHELGHFLFGFSHINGLHRWNLMSGAGSYPPESSGVTMSAYERHKLGWLEYLIVDTTTYGIELENITVSNQAVKIPLGEIDDGYFVLENRQYSDPFEPSPDMLDEFISTIPGTGLLVYYVDRQGPNIIPADGQVRNVFVGYPPKMRLVFNGDNSDLYGNNGSDEIVLQTRSLSPTKERINTHIALRNIRHVKNKIGFDVIFNVDENRVQKHANFTNFELKNYPNPFRLTTKIFLRMPYSGHAKLTVFNQNGQEKITLIDRELNVGEYEVVFHGESDTPGEYSYKLETDKDHLSGTMKLEKYD
ncbi:hypothetical protein JW960_22410 [candidate division KSB1 bacterium]|nr:hypothetical protein [candidate division KSB1 bacterium]